MQDRMATSSGLYVISALSAMVIGFHTVLTILPYTNIIFTNGQTSRLFSNVPSGQWLDQPTVHGNFSINREMFRQAPRLNPFDIAIIEIV